VVEHAALYARKVIAARTAVLRAFADVSSLSNHPEQRDAAEQTRDNLLGSLRSPETGLVDGRPSDNAEHLDAFLIRMSDKHVVGLLKAAKQQVGSEALAERLEVLDERLRSISCFACAAKAESKNVCRASGDSPIVAKGGDCIIELKELFNLSLQLARIAYNQFCPQKSDAMLWANRVGVVLNTSEKKRPHDMPDIPLVSGSTAFASMANGGAVSNVRLFFNEDTFDDAAAQACVYVFVHELIAHAYEGAGISGAIRKACEPNDAWREGWMDCVAFTLLMRAIEGRPPFDAVSPPSWLNLPGLQATAAAYHAARFLKYAPGVKPRSGPISDAGQSYLGMYRSLAVQTTWGTPWQDILLQASLLLSVLGSPPGATDRLLAAARLFRAPGDARLAGARDRVVSALVRFLDHQDSHTLEGEISPPWL
jgi:hypothetical protein